MSKNHSKFKTIVLNNNLFIWIFFSRVKNKTVFTSHQHLLPAHQRNQNHWRVVKINKHKAETEENPNPNPMVLPWRDQCAIVATPTMTIHCQKCSRWPPIIWTKFLELLSYWKTFIRLLKLAHSNGIEHRVNDNHWYPSNRRNLTYLFEW